MNVMNLSRMRWTSGTRLNGKKMRKICPQCECEFEFEKEDIIWGNQREPDNCVKCPCCGRYIKISGVII
jgi:hypothetical protein